MDDPNQAAVDVHLEALWEVEVDVIISLHREDLGARSALSERVENRHVDDVAGVNDDVDVVDLMRDPGQQAIGLAHTQMCVGK